MQTFLPHSDFFKTAKILDDKRLGKQRLEAWQILQTLLGKKQGWKNHPAVKMWEGHERSLAYYGAAMCFEWRNRGFQDTMLNRFVSGMQDLPRTGVPWFCHSEKLLSSHRAALLFKDHSYYGRFGWTEQPRLDYFWPRQTARGK